MGNHTRIFNENWGYYRQKKERDIYWIMEIRCLRYLDIIDKLIRWSSSQFNRCKFNCNKRFIVRRNWLPSPSAFRLFSPALFSVQWVKLDYFSNHLFQEVRKMQMRPFHLSLREDWDRKLWIMLPIHLFLVYTHPNQKLFILVVPFRSWRNSKKNIVLFF